MSFFGLNIASSAIDAFQQAENITADNIANVNTVGASRQQASIVQQQPVVGSPFMFANPANGAPGTVGDGVLVNQILRVHQDSYDALFRGATASQNFYNTEQQTLDGVQSALGEPAAGINTAALPQSLFLLMCRLLRRRSLASIALVRRVTFKILCVC